MERTLTMAEKAYTDADVSRWLAHLRESEARSGERGRSSIRGPQPAWFAVQVETRREKVAKEKIDGLGFRTLLPDYLVLVKGDNGKQKQEPRILFPGYLLVAFDPGFDPWGEIKEQPRVLRIVSHLDGITPWRIPDKAMAHLLGSIAMREFDDKPAEALKPGVRYRLESGRFKDHWVSFQGLRPRERFACFMRMFGGDILVELPCADLRITR